MSGLITVFIMALLCSWLGNLFPVIGAAVFAITLGIVINNTTQAVVRFNMSKGLDYASKKILKYSIVIMGFSFNLGNIISTGISSLSVMLATLTAAFLSMAVFAKIMKVDYNLANLIGVGTAICGGSAIAAVSPVLKADDRDVSYAISTIFLFNIIAAFVFPVAGRFMGMGDDIFGLWAGTAINDTSSVVAAGYSYSEAAGDYAVIVKLTRTTMIVPVAIVYSVIGMYRNRGGGLSSAAGIFPWFIICFVFAAALNSVFVFPVWFTTYAKILSKFMIVMALGGIGLKTDFKKIMSAGFKPLFLGCLVWISVIVSSLAIIFI